MRSNVVAKVVEFCQHNKMDPIAKIPKVKKGISTVANLLFFAAAALPRIPAPQPRSVLAICISVNPFGVVDNVCRG